MEVAFKVTVISEMTVTWVSPSAKILAAKSADPVGGQADTSALEGEIDALVYQLYGLSEDEQDCGGAGMSGATPALTGGARAEREVLKGFLGGLGVLSGKTLSAYPS